MKNSSQFWKDKRVFITGASSGIGEALAEELSIQGAKIGLIARRKDKLDIIVNRLSKAAIQIDSACADVTDAQAVKDAVKKLESTLGHCDVMIANAGIYHKTVVGQFDIAKENAVVNTNLNGVINTVGAVLPAMIERKQGHIVAVSSIAGMIGLPAAASYSASKAAVVSLFESLRVDLYEHGVSATVAAPGFVDTPLITDEERETLKDLITAEQAAKRISEAVERNRAVDWFPWQTAWICRFLSWLPSGLYRRAVANIPDMEEVKT